MFEISPIFFGQIRKFTYLGAFFLAVHFAFTAYISSSFLGKFIDESYVGIIFSTASALSIFTLIILPSLIRRLGNIQTLSNLVFLLLFTILLLSWSTEPILVIGLFIFYYVIGLAIQYSLDLYLEKLSDDSETGGIRALFLSILNLATMAALIVTGFILGTGEEYWQVFLFSGIILLPFLYLVANHLPEIPEKNIESINWLLVIKKIWKPESTDNKNIQHILAIDFLVNFFYALMIIYTPIYLNKYIGLSWSEIGFIFAFMLLPFILFLVPLGKIADRYLGEKEIMSVGLIITGIATITISLVSTPQVIVWGGLMIFNRIGISSVEAMKESYLFKQIDPSDLSILSIARNIRSLAYIFGPIIATIFLFFFDFKIIFTFLGLVMLWGLRHTLCLVDTK